MSGGEVQAVYVPLGELVRRLKEGGMTRQIRPGVYLEETLVEGQDSGTTSQTWKRRPYRKPWKHKGMSVSGFDRSQKRSQVSEETPKTGQKED